jgi:hypothetical protein
VRETHPHTPEELRKDIRPRFKQFSGKNSMQLTTSRCPVVLSSFCRECNISSICCSYGGFLLDFLKVITTATVRLAAFTDRYSSRQPAFESLAAEVQPPLLGQAGKVLPDKYSLKVNKQTN